MGQGVSKYWIEERSEKLVLEESNWFVPGEILKTWCEESGKGKLSKEAKEYYKAGRILHCLRVGFPKAIEDSQKALECLKFFPEATSFEFEEKGYIDIGFPREADADRFLTNQLYLGYKLVPKTRPCKGDEILCLLLFENLPTTLDVSDSQVALCVGLRTYGRVLGYYVKHHPKFPSLTQGRAYAAVATGSEYKKPIPKESFFLKAPDEKFTIVCYSEDPPSYSRVGDQTTLSHIKPIGYWGE